MISALPLNRTFTFTLEEYATLVQIVDEGMWEIAAHGLEGEAHDRVCTILGLPAYAEEDAVAGIPTKG